MVSAIITIITMAVIAIAVPLLGLLSDQSYGSQLEKYINSRNPKDAGDVERMTNEFQRKTQQRYL